MIQYIHQEWERMCARQQADGRSERIGQKDLLVEVLSVGKLVPVRSV